MRLVHSVAMLAIATGVVGTIADVNAASPSSDTQLAESKGITAKGGREFRPNPGGDGTTQQRGGKAGDKGWLSQEPGGQGLERNRKGAAPK